MFGVLAVVFREELGIEFPSFPMWLKRPRKHRILQERLRENAERLKARGLEQQ